VTLRPRLLLALMVAAASLAAVSAIALAAGRGGGRAVVTGHGFAGASIASGVMAPEVRLRDQDGRVFDLARERGHVVVLTFLYSTCQDTCPVIAQQIRGALDQLGHDVPAVAISVDPAQDTPLHAKAFLLEQHLTARMRFLLGDRAQLAPIWRAYGIQPERIDAEHTVHVLLVDGRGRLRVGFPADHLTPEGLAHDIAALEREGAAGGR
jgi:protein SCO1/2